MLCTSTPKPPYYAVVFVGVRERIRAQQNSELQDAEGYATMAEEMTTLAKKQDGFLGVDSAAELVNMTVSYWRDLDSIKNWKNQTRHLVAQKMGREKWYSAFRIRICKVEREYGMSQKETHS